MVPELLRPILSSMPHGLVVVTAPRLARPSYDVRLTVSTIRPTYDVSSPSEKATSRPWAVHGRLTRQNVSRVSTSVSSFVLSVLVAVCVSAVLLRVNALSLDRLPSMATLLVEAPIIQALARMALARLLLNAELVTMVAHFRVWVPARVLRSYALDFR